MQKDELRPICHLNAVSKRFSHAWKMVDKIRARQDKDWPDWCFIPLDGWQTIVRDSLEGGFIDMSNMKGVPINLAIRANMCYLAAIGSWRYTQGIYRFDPDLQTALVDTELTGNIPCEVLLRLPEWSIYIETPGLTYCNQLLHGLWVHLDYWSAGNNQTALRMLFDTEQTLYPFSLNVGPWPLQEAIERGMDEASKCAEMEGVKPPMRNAAVESKLAKQLQPLLSLILYLCSEEPEMNGPPSITTPHRPEAKKTKQGWRLFPADKPTIWRVGKLTGQALHLAKTCVSSHGNSPRTHIRRAHWHGYWTGSGEQKRFKYNWLSPIVVRGREIDEQEQGQTNVE